MTALISNYVKNIWRRVKILSLNVKPVEFYQNFSYIFSYYTLLEISFIKPKKMITDQNQIMKILM